MFLPKSQVEGLETAGIISERMGNEVVGLEVRTLYALNPIVNNIVNPDV